MACGPFDPAIFDPDIFDVCLEFEWQLEAESAPGVWTDITDDVTAHAPLRFRRGGFEWSPMASVARPGSMSFTLDNDNGPGGRLIGRYTPGHANQLPWFKFGTRVRLRLSYGAAARYVWRGKLLTPQPEPDLSGPRIVTCAATDWMAYFANQDALDLELLENVRFDEALQAVVDLMPDAPAHVELDAGSETFTFVFDDLGSRAPKGLQVAHDVTLSDGGMLVLRGDDDEGETLTSYSRRTLVAAPVVFALAEQHLLRGSGNPSIASGPEYVVNEIEVQTAHRRSDTASTSLLVAMDRPILVPAGQTVVTYADYRDPNVEQAFVGGKDIQPLASGTDYTANSAEDGGGVDLTALVTVTASEKGSRVKFTSVNASNMDAWVRGAGEESGPQCRGRGLYRYAPTSSFAENAASIADHGRCPMSSAMLLPYQTSATKAAAIGQMKAHMFGRTPHARGVTLFTPDPDVLEMAILRDIGDKGTVSEAMTALNGNAHIAAIEGEIIPGGHLLMSWELIPAIEADDEDVLILNDPDQGVLDQNVLAFG